MNHRNILSTTLGHVSYMHMKSICEFLCSPLVESLLLTHPNQLCRNYPTAFTLPSQWSSWWAWAGELSPSDAEPKWMLILRYYTRNVSTEASADPLIPGLYNAIPEDLRILIDRARILGISRRPGPVKIPPYIASNTSNQTKYQEHSASADTDDDIHRPDTLRGMSPKKAHEVIRMTESVRKLLASCVSLRNVPLAVDIGAGQAYLSRQLRDSLGLHVLALDWSDVQTQGAARKERIGKKNAKSKVYPVSPVDAGSIDGVENVDTKWTTTLHDGEDKLNRPQTGSLTYRTLTITSETLLNAIDDWVMNDVPNVTEVVPNLGFQQAPVLLVALHACGSLTLNILRAFLARFKTRSESTAWVPRAAVIVGCCYNLLEEGDFPLSRLLWADTTDDFRGVNLTSNHLQLAAQVPSQWLHTEQSLKVAELAVRKVAWRALLDGIIPRQMESADLRGGQGQTPQDSSRTMDGARIGRLNDKAYADWDTFLLRAGDKLGIRLDDRGDRTQLRDSAMESRLEVLHVLRCILGPTVETLILLDRERWMNEELENTDMQLRLVNLFKQEAGSGRNVAIVVHPREREMDHIWP